MFRNLDPVLDTVTVLTPQLIDEGRVGIEPGALRGSAPGFRDTSGRCQGMTPATIVDPGVTVRSRFVSDHRHAASAAARAAEGVRWPSRSMSHSAL
jgi:hypothetical protein